jgi:chromosome partitioning protein
MIVTVTSYKGGVGKTTSAVHLAAFLQQDKPTLLIDGDPNRSASGWVRRGEGFPFQVVDERRGVRFAREYEHIVIDTQARPTREDLTELADGCDMLVVPTTPDALSLDALFLFTDVLQDIGSHRFRILLTIVPPRPSRDGDEARATLEEAKIPLFDRMIRRYIAFQRAALRGLLVSEINVPNAQEGWDDYRKVGEELTK